MNKNWKILELTVTFPYWWFFDLMYHSAIYNLPCIWCKLLREGRQALLAWYSHSRTDFVKEMTRHLSVVDRQQRYLAETRNLFIEIIQITGKTDLIFYCCFKLYTMCSQHIIVHCDVRTSWYDKLILLKINTITSSNRWINFSNNHTELFSSKHKFWHPTNGRLNSIFF